MLRVKVYIFQEQKEFPTLNAELGECWQETGQEASVAVFRHFMGMSPY